MRVSALLAVLLSVLTAGCNRVPPETPSDFAFVFTLQSSGAYTLNTFNETFRRTTTSAGDTTIPFHISKTQLDSVYTLLKGIDFFSLPEYLEPDGGIRAFSSAWCTLHVRANGITKRVRFGGTFPPGVQAFENLNRVKELIIEMIMNSTEYQGLPPSTNTEP